LAEPAGLEPAGLEPGRGALPSVTFVTAFKKRAPRLFRGPTEARDHGPSAQKNPRSGSGREGQRADSD